MMKHANHSVLPICDSQSFCETCGDFVDHGFVAKLDFTILDGIFRPLNADLSQKPTQYWIAETGEEVSAAFFELYK